MHLLRYIYDGPLDKQKYGYIITYSSEDMPKYIFLLIYCNITDYLQ